MAEADVYTMFMGPAVLPVGEKLRRARERGGHDLAAVAAYTKIKQHHLAALERGDYAALPAAMYAVGFARSYARALGLDSEALAREVREELNRRERPAPSPASHHLALEDPAKIPSARLAWLAGGLAVAVLVAIAVFWSSYFSPAAELPPVTAGLVEVPDAPEFSPAAQISPTAESAVAAAAASQNPADIGAPAAPNDAGGAQPPAPSPELSPTRP